MNQVRSGSQVLDDYWSNCRNPCSGYYKSLVFKKILLGHIGVAHAVSPRETITSVERIFDTEISAIVCSNGIGRVNTILVGAALANGIADPHGVRTSRNQGTGSCASPDASASGRRVPPPWPPPFPPILNRLLLVLFAFPKIDSCERSENIFALMVPYNGHPYRNQQ
jgi:hypothetical protein